MSQPRLCKAGEPRQVSPGDLAFLALAFLAVCTTFAVEQGLFLRPGYVHGGEMAGRANTVRVTCTRDGKIEIQGRPASLDMVRPAIERALAGDDRTVVLLEIARGAGYAPVVDVLDQVNLAGAARAVLREGSK